MYLNNSKSLYYHKLDKFVKYGEVPHSSAITCMYLYSVMSQKPFIELDPLSCHFNIHV